MICFQQEQRMQADVMLFLRRSKRSRVPSNII